TRMLRHRLGIESSSQSAPLPPTSSTLHTRSLSVGRTQYRGLVDDSDPAQLVAPCWNCAADLSLARVRSAATPLRATPPARRSQRRCSATTSSSSARSRRRPCSRQCQAGVTSGRHGARGRGESPFLSSYLRIEENRTVEVAGDSRWKHHPERGGRMPAGGL